METKQTPLIDLLERVPQDARCRVDEPDGMGSVFIRVGRLCHEAASALRAALAEQCQCGDRPAAECPGEWEPGCDLGANEAHAKVYEPQEPVAFAFRHSDGSWHDISETEHSAGMTALYTHPAPQRQPLTDEQIIALRKSTKVTDFSAWSDSIAFARAIERTHGIGGQDE